MSKLVQAAQAGGKMSRGKPAGGGKDTMPKGDGLKVAWKADRSAKTDMGKAKAKVR